MKLVKLSAIIAYKIYRTVPRFCINNAARYKHT